MTSNNPSGADLFATRVDVPEDVRADVDAEYRRTRAEPVLGAPIEEVPEDAVAERDLEARLGEEEIRQRLIEGRPPAEDEPRS